MARFCGGEDGLETWGGSLRLGVDSRQASYGAGKNYIRRQDAAFVESEISIGLDRLKEMRDK